MGSKQKIDLIENTDQVKIVANPDEEAAAAGEVVEGGMPEEGNQVVKKTKVARKRGVRYAAVRSQVDKTKTYDPFAAVELIKKLSYSKFDGTVVADALLREPGETIGVTFPHTTGQVSRVAIVNDDLIAQIAAGVIEFDVLITEPRFMPKLAKHAKVLGPKGLMPNPKSGTITENPEMKKKELEGGKTQVKSEKKAPLMHVTLGKVSMETKDLVENLNALIEALKDKVLKLSLSATMSPSVKVTVE